MLTISLVLAVVALIMTMVHATTARFPLWPSVLVLEIAALVLSFPR